MSATTPIKPASEPPPSLTPREWRIRVDPLLMLAAIGLSVCSLIALDGGTRNDIPGNPDYYVIRQAVFIVVALLISYAISRFDYSRLQELRYGIYGLLIVLLLIVLAFGATSRGATSWIDLPFFRFQPSELGKVMLVVALAGFMVSRVRMMGRGTTVRIVALGLLPMMLVILQNDLGSALVYGVGILAILFIGGAPWRHFAVLGAMMASVIAIVLVGAPAVGVNVLQPYQMDRLTSFLDPSSSPESAGYQQSQALIAIGSGEKTGRGVDNATQTELDFIPELHTDFIFAVVAETYGFVGCALVLSLYALLVWRALHILTIAKNLFGALLAGGICAMLLFQLFVNVGMNVGIMPITGVTAPLLSFGGSSVLATFIAIGLLQSVNAQARETAAAKGRGNIFE